MDAKNQKVNIILGCLLVGMIGWLVYSYCIVPLSVEHGYYVTAAKLWAQGMTPWKDFTIQDAPGGIALLGTMYRMVGIEMSSYAASALILLLHLGCVALFGGIMRKIGMSMTSVLFGLLLYVAVLFSSDALMMNMEPVSTFLILCAVRELLSGSRKGIAAAGLLFALAVTCKLQALIFLPVLYLVLPLIKKEENGTQLIRPFTLYVLGALVAMYAVVALSCGDFLWVVNVEWTNLEKVEKEDVYAFLMNLVILTARCSIFFLLLFPFVRKELDNREKSLLKVGLAAYVAVCLLFILKCDMAYGMIAYPFVTLSVVVVLQHIRKEKLMAAVAVAMLVIPVALAVREFRKLDFGKIKQEQMEEIETVRMVVQDCKNTVLLCNDCHEFDLGPQIFAEIPQLRPVNLKTSRFGMEQSFSEFGDFKQAVNDADCIILSSITLQFVFSKEIQYLDEVVDYMENMSSASLTILKRTEDTPEL